MNNQFELLSDLEEKLIESDQKSDSISDIVEKKKNKRSKKPIKKPIKKQLDTSYVTDGYLFEPSQACIIGFKNKKNIPPTLYNIGFTNITNDEVNISFKILDFGRFMFEEHNLDSKQFQSNSHSERVKKFLSTFSKKISKFSAFVLLKGAGSYVANTNMCIVRWLFNNYTNDIVIVQESNEPSIHELYNLTVIAKLLKLSHAHHIPQDENGMNIVHYKFGFHSANQQEKESLVKYIDEKFMFLSPNYSRVIKYVADDNSELFKVSKSENEKESVANLLNELTILNQFIKINEYKKVRKLVLVPDTKRPLLCVVLVAAVYGLGINKFSTIVTRHNNKYKKLFEF